MSRSFDHQLWTRTERKPPEFYGIYRSRPGLPPQVRRSGGGRGLLVLVIIGMVLWFAILFSGDFKWQL